MPWRNKDGTINWATISNVCISLPVLGFILVRGVAIYQLPDEFKEFKQVEYQHNQKVDYALDRLLNGKDAFYSTNTFTKDIQGKINENPN